MAAFTEGCRHAGDHRIARAQAARTPAADRGCRHRALRQQGFDATTIEQIAATADIAPRTLFSYFDSKDDVVLAGYADRLGRIVRELDRRPPDEPIWTALRSSFAMVASDYEAEADRLARRFAIMATTPSVHARSLQLQAGLELTLGSHISIRQGAATGDPEPSLLAAAAPAGMRASLQYWLAFDRTTPLPTLVQETFDRLGAGLAPR